MAQSKESFNSVSWIHTSQSSFWECFCLVFMWRYFLFHHRPQSAPNIHLQILQKECFKTPQSKERFNSVRWMHTSQRSFSECFSLVFMWRYFLFCFRSQSAPNTHLQILQKDCFQSAQSKEMFNSVSWIHTSQRSFWECFCLFFMWRYFLFHQMPQSLLISTCKFYKNSVLKLLNQTERSNSVSWMHTSQRTFWECLCLVFMWRYFLFHDSHQRAPNIYLQILQKECFKTAQSKECFNSVSWMHTSHRGFWECFCLVFMWRYLLLHQRPQSLLLFTCKFYKNSVSKLLNQKKNFQLRELHAHITKNFLRMLLCRFYVKIFPFPPQASKRSKYPLADSKKEYFNTDQSKESFNSVSWMHTLEGSFWECLCLVFMWGYFPFQPRRQNAPNILLQILLKESFKTAQSKERFNSVRWMHTSQRSSSEWFCLVFMWRYFLISCMPQRTPNFHLQILEKK